MSTSRTTRLHSGLVQSIYTKIQPYLKLIATEIILLVNRSSYICINVVHWRIFAEILSAEIGYFEGKNAFFV